jgi:hypothetical protein
MYSEYNWKAEDQNNQKFPLGQVLVTASVLNIVSKDLIESWLKRHQNADWGVVSVNDWVANNDDLLKGNKLLSAYVDSNGVKVWIITEADRFTTTVLLPEEY